MSNYELNTSFCINHEDINNDNSSKIELDYETQRFDNHENEYDISHNEYDFNDIPKIFDNQSKNV